MSDLEQLADDRERFEGAIAVGFERPPHVSAQVKPTSYLDNPVFTEKDLVDQGCIDEKPSTIAGQHRLDRVARVHIRVPKDYVVSVGDEHENVPILARAGLGPHTATSSVG